MVDVSADCEQLDVFVRDQVNISDNVAGLCDRTAYGVSSSSALCGCLGESDISRELGNVNFAEQFSGAGQLVPYCVDGHGGDHCACGCKSSSFLFVQLSADNVLCPCVSVFNRISLKHCSFLLGNRCLRDLVNNDARAFCNGLADLCLFCRIGSACIELRFDSFDFRLKRVEICAVLLDFCADLDTSCLKLFDGHSGKIH